MKRMIVLLAGATLLTGTASSAGAASLRPNGKYAFTSADSCEAQFGFKTESVRLANGKTDTGVRIIESQHDGHIGAGVGTITFTPTSSTGGTFTLSLTDIGGGALDINNGGVNVTTKSQELSGSYSFTSTSLTFAPSSGSTMAFKAAYGALNSAGAPSSVHLARRSSSDETSNCVQSITATK